MREAHVVEQMAQACERDCARLSIVFARYVDSRDYDKLIALFTPDGVLDRRGEIIKGHGAIRTVMEARPAELRTRHICTNIEITQIGPRSAEGLTVFTLYRGREKDAVEPVKLAGPAFVGEYRDRFEHTPEGWRIAHREVRLLFQREPV